LGTHQGAVSRDHLAYYLDEFTFRFNRRRSRSRGKLFYRLLQQAVAVAPQPFKGIVGGTWNDAKPQHIGVAGSSRVMALKRASYDAVVSITPSKIP
jgi:hypothetical protein